MKQIKGKCAEYLSKGLCLGCMQLANEDFEGDDNCIYIQEREKYENWRIE